MGRVYSCVRTSEALNVPSLTKESTIVYVDASASRGGGHASSKECQDGQVEAHHAG
jgi:hypothetical protein